MVMKYEVNVPFVQPGEVDREEEIVFDAVYRLNYEGIWPTEAEIREQIEAELGKILEDTEVSKALQRLVKSERVKKQQ